MFRLSNTRKLSLPKANLLLILFFLLIHSGYSQKTIFLNELSNFKPAGPTWHEAGKAHTDLTKVNDIQFSAGQGILVNKPTKRNRGQDLITTEEFGDIDLDLEVMMAKGSNSGIYLMGQYELQLLDSWTKTQVRPGDMGGIYERWDESRPEGQKGYDGYAPRQNASRAPGVWQQLHISFQAPRFNSSGEKIENAKFIKVVLNGVLIHENLEVFGPTRGPMIAGEIPKGPLRFQGDHGAVAFKNIQVKTFEANKPNITDLKYEVFSGFFNQIPDFNALEAFSKGELTDLNAPIEFPAGLYLRRYQGNLQIEEAGEYTFTFSVPSGIGALMINGKEVVIFQDYPSTFKVNLSSGPQSIELLVAKTRDWSDTGLFWSIEGPGLRTIPLVSNNLSLRAETDPILVNPSENPILRSFINLPDGKRLTHTISIGTNRQLHYSYDLQSGQLIQVWRGEFLDATPMWYNRGNGVAKPMGALVFLGYDEKKDITAKGYQISNPGMIFMYEQMGSKVNDQISALEDGTGFTRTLNLRAHHAATGKEIQKIKDGLFWISDKGYYVEFNPKATKSEIRNHEDRQELHLTADNSITYQILF